MASVRYRRFRRLVGSRRPVGFRRLVGSRLPAAVRFLVGRRMPDGCTRSVHGPALRRPADFRRLGRRCVPDARIRLVADVAPRQ